MSAIRTRLQVAVAVLTVSIAVWGFVVNIVAGLAQTTSGVVTMDGDESSGPSLDRGVVFQNYALLPWLTALGNVRFGVRPPS